MKSLLFLAGKAAITLAVLGFLATRFDMRVAAGFLHRISSGNLGLAILALVLVSVLPALRWEFVLRKLGIRLDFWPSFRLVLIGGFFNQVLPTGVGGDVVRGWYATNKGADGVTAAESVLVDRVLGLAAIVLQTFIGIPYLNLLKAETFLTNRLAAMSTTMACGLLAFLFLDRILARIHGPNDSASPINHSTFQRVAAFLGRVGGSSRRILFSTPGGYIAMGLSLVNQLAISGILHMLFVGCGVEIRPAATLLLFPFVALLSMIPISLAGWGLREGAMVALFSLARVPEEASLGVSILFGFAMLASSLPGGVLWLLQPRANTRIVISPEP